MDARAAQVPRRFGRNQDVAADQPEVPNVRPPLDSRMFDMSLVAEYLCEGV